ncbi:MAG: outer membrane protein assembly factor [Halanaerobiales bacterium]
MNLKMKRMLILLCVFVFIISFNSQILAQEGVQIISEIALEGNEHVADEEILSLVETKVGEALNEQKLKSDLERIYETGYFQDVTISFKAYRGGLQAIFELAEYPLVQDIVVEGNVSYTDERFLSLFDIEKGKILNHTKLIEGRKKVTDLYHDNGYILAGFKDIDISDEGILKLEFNEGYINEIIIDGNEKTRDFVILRELEFSEGDILNIKEMQKSFQKIARLNLFEEFNPQLERVTDQENAANIVIDLTEAKTGNLGAGVTWSSKDGWLGFINVSERNLLGNGQTLGFKWQFGGVTNYSINFHEPWLFGTRTSFGINLYDRSSDGTKLEVDNDVERDYQEHRRGGNISLGHQLVDEWNGRIRLRIEDSTIDWVEDNDADDVNVIDTEEASVRSLTLQVNRDTTNHPFNPTNGEVDTFSVEYAGQILGGDSDFTKYNLDIRRFYPGFRSQHAWALRLKAGSAQGEVPELEKYRLGGSESLRGYENGSFTGEDLLLLNAEYRFPIVENFTGVVFTDAGNAWDEGDEIDLDNLHFSYGAGLRMNTPIGQIRLDYGFNGEGEGQPHFSIGHAF